MFESHLPADLATERPLTLVSNAVGDGPRGRAARLQQQHRPIGGERRRDTRRLAGARLGNHDDGAPAPQR
jgi:hypothetical protein